MSDKSVMTISPQSNRNAITLCVGGSLLLVITLFVANYWWQEIRLQLIMAILVSCLIILFGILKSYQPKVSYVLTKSNLVRVHIAGRWQLNWRDIKRIGRPVFTQGIERIDLPYIGIKLNSLSPIVENISPRLANRLIHEQRDLVMLHIRAGTIEVDHIHPSFEPYKIDGKLIKGPVAAWLHRCELLEKACGYHLFLPVDSLDRSPEQFESLLMACWRHCTEKNH